MAKGKSLVIVESPTKAKKIKEYLGKDYTVLASVGHVRDLPPSKSDIPEEFRDKPWAELGVNVERDFEPIYVVPKEKKKTVKELKDALKEADELILATDEDREGESIGWHVRELLKPKVPTSRIVFSEITKKAILEAMQNRRQLDDNLVSAQETRRVLDRLYGYTLSPLLWHKIAYGLSAGRVQSVAVRVLVQRELERLAFRSGTYWDIKAHLGTERKEPFEAMLQSVGGKRIATGKDFDEHTGRIKEGSDVLLLEEKPARELVARLQKAEWKITDIQEKDSQRSPAAPFTTSTLQQEANNKLGMGARRTMRVAQDLYENGYITYMRTDSVHLSEEAITAARSTVKKLYGEEYLSAQPRRYANKNKSAQEAHEAIRPSGTEMKTEKELGLSGEEAKLYKMIWARTVACQMANCELRGRTVTIAAADAEFKATGQTVLFHGFRRAYVEGSSDPDAALENFDTPLPEMKTGENSDCRELEPLSHETRPPARYTEASLVKLLEEQGVGRPSTYASIISVIQDRGYVRKDGRQLVPTFRAIAVNKLLEQHFANLVDMKFTAKMESQLDEIASGGADRSAYLSEFYSGDGGLNSQVQKKEEEIGNGEAREIQLGDMKTFICLGKHGPYFKKEENGQTLTASIPEELAPADVTDAEADKWIAMKQEGPKVLGVHPETGDPIYVRSGPFGPYVQLGDPGEDGEKPKRAGLPNSVKPDDLDLKTAVALLALPRRIGHHPETGKVVNAGMGKFGPYVLHDKKYGNFDKKTHTYASERGKVYDVLTVDMDAAVEMLSKSAARGGSKALRVLGEHPEDQAEIAIFEGKYGPYIKHKRTFASVPKDQSVESVTLEEALKLLAEKSTAKKTTKKTAKKTPAKKTGTTTVKKKTAKTTKKKAVKKAAKKKAE